MSQIDYETFYNKVGKENGWDFSSLQLMSEGVKWEFYDEVTKRVKKTDLLLDIGTGGGENLLKIASSLQLLIGIDLSKGMMETAEKNLHNSNVSNVRFAQMSSNSLQFPEGFFDVVSCNHAPFDSREVSRVLKSEGLFLTQQVSEADKINIKEAFGRGQSFGEEDGSLKEKYIRELEEAGFSDIQSFDYDATNYFQKPEDLIFLLTHTPIIPYFGEEKTDFDKLNRFIGENQTNDGIRTNSKRFMILAKK
ncbi:class I SAM-dependent methyltransferase [Pseudalkalibacillus hwajinpoensis]|uniref:Class I SAM-dependent methyltransferase n=1 Tax=Guptibacillus hwajinpoensis TaxID=208199 RepID=A0A4V5PZ14_9BACL|nr:class I SAM-dependent methyltransferase [Pseudalkalibacillus hwajinpoensis]TKD72138.1 class I SAM-dependent methyltransferase [Pseudalkalibacillus hwajinpoensis]